MLLANVLLISWSGPTILDPW